MSSRPNDAPVLGGRVEGTLVLDSQPVGNERVIANSSVARYDDDGRRFGFVDFYFEAKTDFRFGALCDRNGSFRVPDVPAGTYQLEICATPRPIL